MFWPRRNDEDGSITVLALFLFVAVCVVLGITLDVSNAYSTRTQLQVAADTGGHAALYMRTGKYLTEDDAKEVAANLAAKNLVADPVNNVVGVEDIEFGIWNRETRIFTPRSGSYSAVRVTATRSRARDNQLETFLLGFAGLNYWNISTHSVTETYRPGCLREGMVSEDVLDIQSNNGFAANFCLHSNTYISVNQNNIFDAGSIVSMPDLGLFEMPHSGYERNDGLEEALRENFYEIHVLDRIQTFIEGIESGLRFVPDYIDSTTVNEIPGDRFAVTDFEAGKIYRLNCETTVVKGKTTTTSVASKVTISKSTAVSPTATDLNEVVIIAECPVQFGRDVVLDDVVFFNESTDPESFTAPDGLTIGRDDLCSPGGGAQLLTFGGMRFAADLGIFGGQLIAKQDIQFAARAGAMEGASIISGGEIDGTSNAEMGYCGSGMEDNFEVDYYRLVE